jgi:DNA-binding NtrC family response regulator
MPVEVLLIEDSLPEARLVQLIIAQSSLLVKITTANDCSGALVRLSDVQIKPNLVIADMGA